MTDREQVDLEGQAYYDQKHEEHAELVDCLAVLGVVVIAVGVVFYVAGLVKDYMGA